MIMLRNGIRCRTECCHSNKFQHPALTTSHPGSSPRRAGLFIYSQNGNRGPAPPAGWGIRTWTKPSKTPRASVGPHWFPHQYNTGEEARVAAMRSPTWDVWPCEGEVSTSGFPGPGFCGQPKIGGTPLRHLSTTAGASAGFFFSVFFLGVFFFFQQLHKKVAVVTDISNKCVTPWSIYTSLASSQHSQFLSWL